MSMPIHRSRPQHTTLRPPVVPAFLHPLILYITPLLHPPSHTITLTNQQHLHCMSYHSALSVFSDGPFPPMRLREGSWDTSTAMFIMTSPGNISLNTGGDNWRSFSFKRPILSHRRFSPKDDDLGLENEDRMNDVRCIGSRSDVCCVSAKLQEETWEGSS